MSVPELFESIEKPRRVFLLSKPLRIFLRLCFITAFCALMRALLIPFIVESSDIERPASSAGKIVNALGSLFSILAVISVWMEWKYAITLNIILSILRMVAIFSFFLMGFNLFTFFVVLVVELAHLYFLAVMMSIRTKWEKEAITAS